MKKTTTILIIVFLVFVTYLVYENYFPVIKTLGNRYSYSIEHSKKKSKNIFLFEYIPLSNVGVYNINIRSSFIEKQHGYDNYNSKVNIDSVQSQFIISFTKKLTTLSYKENWNIKGYKSINPYSIVKNYGYLPRDTIVVDFLFTGDVYKKIKFVKK